MSSKLADLKYLILHSLTTKIALNTEILDSASAYDTSTYRFTPQTAGKYFFYGQIYFETTSSSNNYNNLVTLGTIIQKNGSNAAHNYIFRGKFFRVMYSQI